MNVNVKIIKEVPRNQINSFEDKTIYNTAILTREYTKSENAFPYLTGKLQRSETSSQVIGSNKEYGLTAGVNYAKRVWQYNNVNWTNKSTEPQWYYNTYRRKSSVIVANAYNRALKEV